MRAAAIAAVTGNLSSAYYAPGGELNSFVH